MVKLQSFNRFCLPRSLGKWSNFHTRIFFSNGLVEPPTGNNDFRLGLWMLFCRGFAKTCFLWETFIPQPLNTHLENCPVFFRGSEPQFLSGMFFFCLFYVDVSENSGTPKSSILIGFSIINHPFWGTTIFGNIHVVIMKIPAVTPLRNFNLARSQGCSFGRGFNFLEGTLKILQFDAEFPSFFSKLSVGWETTPF